jgi:uncharacterized membrane protein YphA (DoxX/SURF4 family)
MKDCPLNNRQSKTSLMDPRIEFTVRWILGAILIYSSWHKLLEPAQFARILYQYDLFPATAVNLVAVFVPFLQLIVGAAFISGIYPRSSALLCAVMLLLFTVTLTVNVLRGHHFDCGCFSISEIGSGMSPKMSILRNLALLVMGLYLLWFPEKRWGCLRPGAGSGYSV